ncbi:MAG: M48 family metallopeptidase [Verrucomicrobiota bacterium]|nr:M48 family metallopeptidase [Verrucomicrobiota bacterium]
MIRLRTRPKIEAHLKERPYLSVEGRLVPVYFLDATEGSEAQWDFNAKADTLAFYLNGSPERELLLKNLLREVAGHAIIPRARQLATKSQLKFSDVNIRDQRSRWGSCSGRKALSFNWRLVLLPPHLHDYVIYHELAHLKHFNHSDKFWSFLNELDPNSEAHDKELTTVARSIIPLGMGLK